MADETTGLESIIQEAAYIEYGNNTNMANLAVPGPYGIATQTRFIDASAPLVLEPVVPIVLKTPTMYDPYTDLQMAIKNIIETHATTISGIDHQLTLEVASRVAGNDGQNLETPTQTKRSAVSPSFVIPEVYGNHVGKIMNQWVMDINHPDSNIAFSRFSNPPPFIPSAYSMSVLFIQFDPTHRPENIIDAILISNMFPKDPGGGFGFEKSIGAAKTPERTIQFSGIAQSNKAIFNLAVQLASELQLHKANLDLLPSAYSQVADGIRTSGIVKELESIPKI